MSTAGIGGIVREAFRSASKRGRNLRWRLMRFSVHWLPVQGIAEVIEPNWQNSIARVDIDGKLTN